MVNYSVITFLDQATLDNALKRRNESTKERSPSPIMQGTHMGRKV